MKITVIAQHIFPIQTPRAHRTTELVKELSRQGHEITLHAVLGKYNYENFCKEFNIQLRNIPVKFEIHPYTSDGDGKRNLIDKILGKLLGKLEFPSIEFMFSVPEIFKNAQGEKSDLLISISNPHHIHWGCAVAKKKFPDKFPRVWIADCGDPFMNNGTSRAHLSFFSKYEKMFCSACDYITVPHANAVNGYYEEFRSKIRVIPQGFDFELNKNNSDFSPNTPITFAYAGVFLSDIRNPAKFLGFLQNYEGNFKFIVYTPYRELIQPFEKSLKEKLEIRKPIPRTELLEQLKHMDFLLNLENANTMTAVPSKLIDYAITQRPILSVNPNDIDEKIVRQFLEGNYANRYIVQHLENYHISNVAKQFIALAK